MEENWQGWELARIEAERRQRNVYGICWTAFGVCLLLLLAVHVWREPRPIRLITLGSAVYAAIPLLLARAGRTALAATLLIVLSFVASVVYVVVSDTIGPAPYYASLSVLVAVTTLKSRAVLVVTGLGGSLLAVIAARSLGHEQAPMPPNMIMVNALSIFVCAAAVSVLQARGHEQAVDQGIQLAQERSRIHAEHERLTEELERSRKMEALGRLAGGVSHEFNNLLHVIQASTDFARTLDISTDVERELGQIDRAAERGALLTRSLLAFAERQVMDTEELDVSEATEEILPLLSTLLGSNIEVSFSTDGPAVVRCSVAELEQVLMNLCSNSRDAMPDGGRLSIRVSTFDAEESEHFGLPSVQHALVELADTGQGIAPELFDRIFEPFFTTKGQAHGAGLGLSTSLGIVKQLGGRLVVESDPGWGCTMRIWLPLVERSVDGQFPAEPITASRPLHIGTMLIVEDEDDLRNLTARIFAPYATQVLTAKTITEALALSAEHKEDLDYVLSDVVLRGGESGIELTRGLLDRHPRAAFTVMSGFVGDNTTLPQELLQRVSFLPKPFNSERALGAARLAQKRRRFAGRGADPA